jgi:hypothetical protein
VPSGNLSRDEHNFRDGVSLVNEFGFLNLTLDRKNF